MELTTRSAYVDVAASPEQVWHALTDRAASASWYFGTGIESSFEDGAPYRYAFPDGRTAIEGVVLAAEMPRRLEMTFHAVWSEDVATDEPTRVTWSIEELGEGSRVCVTHENLVPGSVTEKEVATGWPTLLSRLKTYVENARV